VCEPTPSAPHLQAFLGLAFSVEGLLLAFHLKGNSFEVLVHYLLVLLVASCVTLVLLEAAFPSCAILSFARCYFVFLQGTWFCQAGRMLFLGNPAWGDSDDYMGGVMFLPVMFVTHLMLVALGMVGLYLGVAYSMGSSALGQRGFDAIERANNTTATKIALLDLSSKADRAAVAHLPLHAL
jgi:hypothetical protein